MGLMIIFPEDLDFYERCEAAQRRRDERRQREDEREAAWWRLVREERERVEARDAGEPKSCLRCAPASGGLIRVRWLRLTHTQSL
jgi:hypothetical protein